MFRFLFVALFAFLGIACCGHFKPSEGFALEGEVGKPEEADREWGWPDLSMFMRLEVLPGVSVLAPVKTASRWDRPPEMEHPYDITYGWDGPDSTRKLMVAIRRVLPLQESATDAQKREVAIRELIPSDPSLRGVRSLQLGPYPGLAHESLWEGMLVRRRVYVVGVSGIVLYAASSVGDSFPEANVFFRSLAMAPTQSPAPCP